jgi:CHAT domain-containing protein
MLENLRGAHAVVLVPGGLLGLLPLHAAWTPDSSRPTARRYALDMAVFSYVPSARSLAVACAASARPTDWQEAGKALVVTDPEAAAARRLPFAGAEAEAVAWHFPRADVLRGSDASVAQVSSRLSKARLAHLACHGFANLGTPLESGLILAGDESLRVRQVRDLEMDARLTVLSACETGVAGTPLPDEVVAMPTGLLQAGVAGIVASLWSVSDRATTMLMAEFYRRLCRENQAPAEALRGAQQWMRDTTNAEKALAWETGAGDWLPPDVAKQLRSSLGETAGRVYSSPWWWAAFVHVGA